MNIVWNAVRYMAGRGLLYGAGLGALYGTALIFFFPYSTLLGAFFGGVIGLPGGAGCGLISGILTACFFYPLTDPLIYRRTLTTVCTLFGFVATLAGFSMLFQVDSEMLAHSAGIPFVIIPSMIAAGVAAHVSRGFARRYSNEKRKKDKPKREAVYV